MLLILFSEQLSSLMLSKSDSDAHAQLAPNPLNINCSVTSFGGNFLSASISSPTAGYAFNHSVLLLFKKNKT